MVDYSQGIFSDKIRAPTLVKIIQKTRHCWKDDPIRTSSLNADFPGSLSRSRGVWL